MIRWRFVSRSELQTSQDWRTRKNWMIFWVEVVIRWGLNPLNRTFISNFSWVVVWIDLCSSRLQRKVEYCRLLFIMFTGRLCYLKYCVGWLILRLSSINGQWCRSGAGGLEFVVLWTIWRFSFFISTQWRDWFLVSIRMSSFWVGLNSERGFKSRWRFQWKWNIRERSSRIFRGRSLRMRVMTQQCRDRTWCWPCTRGRRWLIWAWSQILRMGYSLIRGCYGVIWLGISSYKIQEIINRRCE